MLSASFVCVRVSVGNSRINKYLNRVANMAIAEGN